MVGRVLIGKRGSDYGLFVSQKYVEVTNTALTTPLAFDSRSVRGLIVHAKGEGTLAAPSGGIWSTTQTNIAHGISYTPLVAVRWCTADDLSSGVATKMWSPHVWFKRQEFSSGSGEERAQWQVYNQRGFSIYLLPSSPYTLNVYNKWSGESLAIDDDPVGAAPSPYNNTGAKVVHYAYIIFKCKDFTNGAGL